MMTEKQLTKFPRWLIILISGLLTAICCLIMALVLNSVFKINVDGGNYDIEQVILSADLKDNRPVDVKNVFKPSDTIICTVKTTGVDGIVGMRWFFGEQVIYQTTGKTQNNIISSYIRSDSSSVLTEGKYRVEIFMAKDPIQIVYFEIRTYYPSVIPPISTPVGHTSVELPWFTEVPFSFDEVWIIGDDAWNVNEVKIVLRDASQEYFVAVVVDTDMDNVASLSESVVREITLPIARYTLEHGYLEKAKSFTIDGKHYNLDQLLFVILINPSSHEVYRNQFSVDDLTPNN
jgi:hypothetical protein